MLDVMGIAVPPLQPVINFLCVGSQVATNLVDEDFTNCLVGLDSMLSKQE